MNKIVFLHLLLFLLLVSGVHADTWHVAGATQRVRIDRRTKSPWPCEAGRVLLWPNGMDTKSPKLHLCTPEGTPVGHEILWAAEGEPLKVLFDCSSGKTSYLVYLGAEGTNRPAAWTRKAGLILETRTRDKASEGEWKDPRTIYPKAKPVLGRTSVDTIFHGIHPHGPSRNFLSYYSGTLKVAKPGKYVFATVSDDASYLLVNGHTVAEWPGVHDTSRGRRGQYQGSLTLKAGRHKIEYYNALDEYGFMVVGAWKPPGQKHLEVIPAEAFVRLADFDVAGHQARPGATAQPYFTWDVPAHVVLGELALVTVRFKVLEPRKTRTYRWTFDDGTTAQGPLPRHLYLRPGMRRVSLEVFEGKKRISNLAQPVHVGPDWSQRHQWPDKVFEQIKTDILARDLTPTPLPDLTYLLDLANTIEDKELLSKIGEACFKRKKEFKAEHAEAFYTLGFHYQDPAIRQYGLAEQAFRTVLALVPAGEATAEHARLHLSGFLIHGREALDDADALLKQITEDALNDADKRLKKIYEADLLLAQGHVDAAKKSYLAVGTMGDPADLEAAMRRRGRLERAKDLLRANEYDHAETIVRLLEWEAPIERSNMETGLVMIGVNLGRKEYPFAFSHCRRLLNAAPTNRYRAEILSRLVEASFALNRRDYGQQALKKLYDDHPYSEAAALARDRWGQAP